MCDPNIVPIVFAADNNYVKPLGTVIVSILESSAPETKYEFNILTSDISDENQGSIRKILKRSSSASINFIDVKNAVKTHDLSRFCSAHEGTDHISIEAWFRFFIADLFPQHRKMIYLDADILVLRDLRDLYQFNIEKHFLGVVNDYFTDGLIREGCYTRVRENVSLEAYMQDILKIDPVDYFNSGVLLMNLDKMRKEQICVKLFDFVEKKAPFEFMDQCVLNAVLGGSILKLPDEWNFYIGNPCDNPSIVHYVGPFKPWNSEAYDFVQWAEYAKETPYWDADDEKKLSRRKKVARMKRQLFAVFIHDGILTVRLFGWGKSLKLGMLRRTPV